MKQLRISQQQRDEWADSLVTKELKRLIEKYLNEYIGEIDAFQPFEPNKTQELLAGINGSIDTWEDIIELLAGNWELVDEEEED